ncbi:MULTISPECIES: helix-turn-helix domain-containing protein [unclassified Psychrobacillus]|uniref:helix-turn-helix domain-containing protein n=1 Tax=unclassified Psychrobacillus TaxID=2636677 RepID=UPI0030F68ABB
MKNDSFGEMLRTTRVAEQMTLKELSVATGLSSSYISRMERDQRTPSVESLRLIAGSLPLSLSQLLQATGHEIPDVPFIELSDMLKKEMVLHGKKAPKDLTDALKKQLNRYTKKDLT